MPRSSPLKNNFSAGELSPLMEGRVDIDRYQAGLKLCKNYVPTVQGPATRRPGTVFLEEVKTSSAFTRLIPFQFNTEQAYFVEASNGAFRFYRDAGPGLLLLESGGSPVEVLTPYITADIPGLRFTQSADVLYLVHPRHAPRKLERTSSTSFTLTEIDFLDGPYLPLNTTAITLALSGVTGSVSVTASSPLFASTDIGRLLRWRDPAGNWTWLEINVFSSSTLVGANIRGPDASAGAATSFWRFGFWGNETGLAGFPATATFFDQRLVLAGAGRDPQRIDGSVIGDFENFRPTEANGTVVDDNAVSTTLLASTVNAIQWMLDDEKGLVVGTTGGEWLVSPADATSTITPTNTKQSRFATRGSKGVQPVRAGSNIVFVQRGGRQVFEADYLDSKRGFGTFDVSLFSEHLTAGGITELAYSQSPYPIIWAVRADGTLLSILYDRDREVIGWAQHQIGGVSDANGTQAKVESVAVIPAPNSDNEYVGLIVQRYVNGAVVRHVEYLSPYWREGDLVEDAVYSDSAVVYDGSATTTITGLDHLEGETVTLIADGAAHPDRTVASGQITLARSASKVNVGLKIEADGQLLRFESGAADGTAMGKTQRIHRLFVRLWQTLGLKVGQDASNLDEVTFRTSADEMDNPPELFTGDLELPFEQDYSNEALVYWRQDQPFPGTILAFMPHMKTEDRG